MAEGLSNMPKERSAKNSTYICYINTYIYTVRE